MARPGRATQARRGPAGPGSGHTATSGRMGGGDPPPPPTHPPGIAVAGPEVRGYWPGRAGPGRAGASRLAPIRPGRAEPGPPGPIRVPILNKSDSRHSRFRGMRDVGMFPMPGFLRYHAFPDIGENPLKTLENPGSIGVLKITTGIGYDIRKCKIQNYLYGTISGDTDTDNGS